MIYFEVNDDKLISKNQKFRVTESRLLGGISGSKVKKQQLNL
jgi:hypothetical protein